MGLVGGIIVGIFLGSVWMGIISGVVVATMLTTILGAWRSENMAIGLFILGICAIGYYVAAAGGRVMFRPNTVIDWVVWSIAIACLAGSLYFFVVAVNKRRRRNVGAGEV